MRLFLELALLVRSELMTSETANNSFLDTIDLGCLLSKKDEGYAITKTQILYL